ncbi:MAG: hypothetical protein CL910_14395 [Deltaproteobacteria bacterium]|nr:hypothetical protein [Deltaproteobacteria bacterium]
MSGPDLESFLGALEAPEARQRADAASSLGDLSRGDMPGEDFERVVAALLARAARESEPEALEAILYTVGELVDRPSSGAGANWDPLVPLLGTLNDPECKGYVLTALGLARHERYRTAIEPYLTDGHSGVREAARGALAELDHASK